MNEWKLVPVERLVGRLRVAATKLGRSDEWEDLRDDLHHAAAEIERILQMAQAEPVGVLTVFTVRGHLENSDFDYTGDLPDGSYSLYLAPPEREPLTNDEMAAAVKYADNKITAGRAVEQWHGIRSKK